MACIVTLADHARQAVHNQPKIIHKNKPSTAKADLGMTSTANSWTFMCGIQAFKMS